MCDKTIKILLSHLSNSSSHTQYCHPQCFTTHNIWESICQIHIHTLSHTHTHRTHPYCLILIHIEVIHIVSYSYTHKTWNRTHCLMHTHITYQDLRISRRHVTIGVMSTTIWSIVEEPLDKWVSRPALLFIRCSHSGRWSVILQMDLIDQGVRDIFLIILI
jgi:hypothetical protein